MALPYTIASYAESPDLLPDVAHWRCDNASGATGVVAFGDYTPEDDRPDIASKLSKVSGIRVSAPKVELRPTTPSDYFNVLAIALKNVGGVGIVVDPMFTIAEGDIQKILESFESELAFEARKPRYSPILVLHDERGVLAWVNSMVAPGAYRAISTARQSLAWKAETLKAHFVVDGITGGRTSVRTGSMSLKGKRVREPSARDTAMAKNTYDNLMGVPSK